MQYRDIAGKKAAKIAFGSTYFGGKVPESMCRELLDTYRAMGGNFIDTAHVYGDFATPRNGVSERVIGKWMSDRHLTNEIFLSTKGAHHVLGTPSLGRLSREEIKRDMSESLEALMCERVDIYWLHRDNPACSVGEVMETLHELVESGQTRLIGASNWSVKRITEANDYAVSHGLTPFYGNQPRFSLPEQGRPEDASLVGADAEMVEMHRRTQMLMTPFSSQAHGFLSKLDEMGTEAYAARYGSKLLSEENLGIYRRCKEVSNAAGLSVGAIGLLWLCGQDFPLVPLVGASRPEQLSNVAEAADAVLTKEQIEYIRRV